MSNFPSLMGKGALPAAWHQMHRNPVYLNMAFCTRRQHAFHACFRYRILFASYLDNSHAMAPPRTDTARTLDLHTTSLSNRRAAMYPYFFSLLQPQALVHSATAVAAVVDQMRAALQDPPPIRRHTTRQKECRLWLALLPTTRNVILCADKIRACTAIKCRIRYQQPLIEGRRPNWVKPHSQSFLGPLHSPNLEV